MTASIEEQLQAIADRNKRVEREKAWEVSITRKCSIAAITYITVCLFLMLTNTTNIFLGALVPVLGYVLSTLSLPFVKRMWLRKNQ